MWWTLAWFLWFTLCPSADRWLHIGIKMGWILQCAVTSFLLEEASVEFCNLAWYVAELCQDNCLRPETQSYSKIFKTDWTFFKEIIDDEWKSTVLCKMCAVIKLWFEFDSSKFCLELLFGNKILPCLINI